MAENGLVVGVGIDLVPIGTMEAARFKDRVAEYFLTDAERAFVPTDSHKVQHLASRFAVKEAVIKAFPEKLSPFDFSVVKDGVRPKIQFVDPIRQSMYRVEVSLTHTPDTAGAIAVVTKHT
jgi:holo-[acyl-carrier-protein] synthase